MGKRPIFLKLIIFITLGIIAVCSQLSVALAEQSTDVEKTNTIAYCNSQPEPTENTTRLNYTYKSADDDNLNQDTTDTEAVDETCSMKSETLVFYFEGNNTVKITYNVLAEEVGNSSISY